VVATSKALPTTERQQLEQLGAVVLPKSSLSLPDASERLADALHRAGYAGTALPPAASPGGP
jgi:hypothetical protein